VPILPLAPKIPSGSDSKKLPVQLQRSNTLEYRREAYVATLLE
jgi:hypothetical protein